MGLRPALSRYALRKSRRFIHGICLLAHPGHPTVNKFLVFALEFIGLLVCHIQLEIQRCHLVLEILPRVLVKHKSLEPGFKVHKVLSYLEQFCLSFQFLISILEA